MTFKVSKEASKLSLGFLPSNEVDDSRFQVEGAKRVACIVQRENAKERFFFSSSSSS